VVAPTAAWLHLDFSPGFDHSLGLVLGLWFAAQAGAIPPKEPLPAETRRQAYPWPRRWVCPTMLGH
jgi:hypothetical protein